MTELNELFKCDICGNVVEIAHEGANSLVCCNENMEKLKENEAKKENLHYAHIEKINENERKISFKHEMTPKHHIEFIEAISNDGVYLKRKYLKETEPAEMILKCKCEEGFYIRLYCNRDGVWVTKL